MTRFRRVATAIFLIISMCIALPSPKTVSGIEKDVCESLSNRYYTNEFQCLTPRICACCNRFATIENPMQPLTLDGFLYCMSKLRVSRPVLESYFPTAVIESYRAKEERLDNLVLSPETRVYSGPVGEEVIDLCTECETHFNHFLRSKKRTFDGPKEAVFNGNLCGDPPDCLRELNAAELALISPNRILTHALVLQCDNHDGIVGWHSMFENSVETNVSNIQLMIDSGLQSEFLCVLCGPWTKIQLDKVKNAYRVRPEKVIQAFSWLKENNAYFRDIVIPPPEQMRNVRILHHHTFETRNASESEIENEINVMILLPDSQQVGDTNGVFDSQEEFRRFLLENGSAHIQKTFFTKPTKERPKEYLDDEFVRAFPLQFPFGTGGFSKEKKLSQFFKKQHHKQSFKERVRTLLKSRPSQFHRAQFNLVSNGILMKNDVFQNVRLQCNLRYEQSRSMGSKFGAMKSSDLENSITKARHMTKDLSDSDKFLTSISAVSECLPHSNEAADAAKQDYFLYLVTFGLPALMVTISPDDQRGLWIQVALHRNPTDFDPGSVDHLDDSDLVILYKKRCGDRLLFPGLCAEEYMAIVETFIRDVLKWDIKTSKSTGIGLFGKTVAFTAATEEQGRKTLHGHFLVWIEGWNTLLDKIMSRRGLQTEFKKACNDMKKFVEHCASSETFNDCHARGDLSEVKPFEHEGCRNQRQTDVSRFTVNPVSARIFDEMRHNDTCYLHDGHIADCPNCKKEIKFEEVMDHSLKCVSESQRIRYDRSKRRLESQVFELQKDKSWSSASSKDRAKRLFLSNVLSNTHTIHHTKRCFKKSGRCYTDFPIEPCDRTRITFAETASPWCDFNGNKTTRYLFEITLKRRLEDCFTNTHNRMLTSAFLCNNNIIAAMTGAAVIYLTCYSVKKTQKEEREAFERVASVVVGTIRRQEEEEEDSMNNFLIDQVGFRRLMLAVMIHTSSLVIAAPMAHYIAINGSRHRYSHDRQHIPHKSLSKILKGESVSMHLSLQKNTERIPFCSALNYIHRPTDKRFERLSPWEFWTKYRVVEKTKITTNTVCYAFPSNHPKHGKLVIVERTSPVVPKIDWTYFGDAKNLSYCITTKPKNPSSNDEDHCRKLLTLFGDYRKEEDLSSFNPGTGERSYCHKFYHLYNEGRFDGTKRIMQNIQNIRNSLDAGRMNSKNLVDESEAEEECEEESPDGLAALQSEIAAFFFRSEQKRTDHPEQY